MSKHVGLTYSMSSEDEYPTYSFFTYEDVGDDITIYQDLTDEEIQYLGAIAQLRKRRKRERQAQLEEEYESDDRSDLIY